jgi:hypothetical protein
VRSFMATIQNLAHIQEIIVQLGRYTGTGY